MGLSDQDMIVLYNDGLSIQQIAKIAGRGRETVRTILKRHGVRMRFRGVKYDPLSTYPHEKKLLLAELLGYLMGDGSISKRKDGGYDCVLSFGLDEKNLVDRAVNIVKQLFGYNPKVVNNSNWYAIVLRRSIGRYLHEECGYPVGKKSIINPHIPAWITQESPSVKAAFIRSFLSAEASVDKTYVKVQQSVRIFLPENVRNRLRQGSKVYDNSSFRYNWLCGEEARSLIGAHMRHSNLLVDLQKLLSEFLIDSKICFNRVWASSKSGAVSLHYELYAPKKMFKCLGQLKNTLD